MNEAPNAPTAAEWCAGCSHSRQSHHPSVGPELTACTVYDCGCHKFEGYATAAEREGEPLTAEPVDVHVRLEGLNRDTAIRLIEDMIYYLKRGTTGYQGFSPGYLGFFPKGADNDSPIAAQTAALLAARRGERALRDALEWIAKEPPCEGLYAGGEGYLAFAYRLKTHARAALAATQELR